MALEDYRNDMEGCSRCSSCKWVPYNQIKSWRFAKNCPSMMRYNFHSYSGSGRMITALSTLQGRSELNDDVTEMIYRCQMCGACDTACKVYRDDIDLTEVLLELRAHCVESGQLIIEHMAMIDAMKKYDNVIGEPKEKRGDWAAGLPVKDVSTERAEVFFHAGCRFSYDEELGGTVRGVVELLLAAGADIGIAGREESCCGARAYELGYRGEASNYAEDMLSRVKASGASTLITACSDGYAAFKFLYPRMGKELPCRVVHATEYLAEMAGRGRLKPTRSVPLKVTYHDPCHLGRMAEPFLGQWSGSKLERPMSMKRAGRNGCYDAPRDLLRAVPGIELVEMERIREYSLCCGAGGGVYEAFPDFASWAAAERLEEAAATGADALVTACPWCEKVFKETARDTGLGMEIFDVSDIVIRSTGG